MPVLLCRCYNLGAGMSVLLSRCYCFTSRGCQVLLCGATVLV